MKMGQRQRLFFLLSALLLVLTGMAACTPAPIYSSNRGETPPRRTRNYNAPPPVQSLEPEQFHQGQVLYGEASYYGPKFHGKMTANGETFDQNQLTCAHKTLPFGTTLKVTLLSTRKSVIVRVNDRGPYKKGRIIDLSTEAARRVGMIKEGTGTVSAEILSLGTP